MANAISQLILETFTSFWSTDSDSSDTQIQIIPMDDLSSADETRSSTQSSSPRADHDTQSSSSTTDASHSGSPIILHSQSGNSENSEIDDLEAQTRRFANRTSMVHHRLRSIWEKAFQITLYIIAYLILHSLHSLISTSNSSSAIPGTVVVMPIQTFTAVTAAVNGSWFAEWSILPISNRLDYLFLVESHLWDKDWGRVLGIILRSSLLLRHSFRVLVFGISPAILEMGAPDSFLFIPAIGSILFFFLSRRRSVTIQLVIFPHSTIFCALN